MRWLVLSLSMLLACGGNVEPVNGAIRQVTGSIGFHVQPKMRFMIVVGTKKDQYGDEIRRKASDAIRARLETMAKGEGPLAYLHDPVDVVVHITNVSKDADDPPMKTFTWREEEATIAGATQLANRIEAELGSLDDRSSDSPNYLFTENRLWDRTHDPDESREDIGVLVTSDSDFGTSHIDWLEFVPAMTEDPAFPTFLHQERMDCLPRPIRACRVRALAPKWYACDAARGWCPSTEPSPDGRIVCDVHQLGGDQARACESGDALPKSVSGWCIQAPTDGCAPSPVFVGYAAPPWTELQYTCNE